MAMPNGSGRVLDTFELSGRGVVVFVGDIEGEIRPGDRARLCGQTVTIDSIESVRFADAARYPSDTIGLPISGIDITRARAAIGERLVCEEGAC